MQFKDNAAEELTSFHSQFGERLFGVGTSRIKERAVNAFNVGSDAFDFGLQIR